MNNSWQFMDIRVKINIQNYRTTIVKRTYDDRRTNARRTSNNRMTNVKQSHDERQTIA